MTTPASGLVRRVGRTFRLFVSSTFLDLRAERDALQKHVFPRLRDLCLRHDCRFQAIDLRWGVREEAALDQQTMRICLDELRRCQQITPRPNFLILLGDRYGWRPLPARIPAAEFEEILAAVHAADDRDMLLCPDGVQEPAPGKQWYRKDFNAVPPEYVLRPRVVDIRAGTPAEEADRLRAAEAAEWAGSESRIRAILLRGVEKAGWPDDDPRRLKYEASATHQEIVEGALSPHVADGCDHVFAFFRHIRNTADLAQGEGPVPAGLAGFVDCVADGHGNLYLDRDAHVRQQALKNRLWQECRDRITEYEVTWADGLSWDHIGSLPADLDECLALNAATSPPNNLCTDAWRSLSASIQEEIAYLSGVDPFLAETEAHAAFARRSAARFFGRAGALRSIRDYVESSEQSVLIVHGPAGSGKSALLGKAAFDCRGFAASATDEKGALSKPIIVQRFVGLTAASCDTTSLLAGLCSEMADACGDHNADVPTGRRELLRRFAAELSREDRKRPLLLFLDGLGQLEAATGERILEWIPPTLPNGVGVVLSISDCGQESEADSADLVTLARKLHPEATFVAMGAMASGSSEALLDSWLAEAGRTLQPAQRRLMLEKCDRVGLPSYVRLAFGRARSWSSYTAVQDLALANDVRGLIRESLEDLSRPQRHGSIRVSRPLAFLAASREGLAEEELLAVLADDKDYWNDIASHARHGLAFAGNERRVPIAVWSRLRHDLGELLYERSADGTTLLALRPGETARAIRSLYLPAWVRDKIHLQLAEYFQGLPLCARKADESFLQLSRAASWVRLKEALSDIVLFELAYLRRGVELVERWSEVLKHTGKGPWASYEATWRTALEAGQELWGVSMVLGNLGDAVHAEQVVGALVEHLRGDPDKERELANALQGYAQFFACRNEHRKAGALLEEAVEIYRRVNVPLGVAGVFSDLAGLRTLKSRGESMRLLEEAEKIYRGHNALRGVIGCRGNQANLLMEQDRLQEAGCRQKEALELARMLGDPILIAEHEVGLAGLLKRAGQTEQALALLAAAERTFRRLHFDGPLGQCLGQQANIHAARGDKRKALALNDETLGLLRDSGQDVWFATCLFNQARLCLELREYSRGVKVASEACEMLARCNAPPPMQQECARILSVLRQGGTTPESGGWASRLERVGPAPGGRAKGRGCLSACLVLLSIPAAFLVWRWLHVVGGR